MTRTNRKKAVNQRPRPTRTYLLVGLVDEVSELDPLAVDGLGHGDLVVVPVLDVGATRADCGLAVAAVETQSLA